MMKTLRHLHCFRLPTNYTEADAYLRQRWETVQLLAIYQHYFPSKMPGGWTTNQEKLLPQGESPYSEAELQCFALLDKADLFPFSRDYVLMCADEGGRSPTIPLYTAGIDHWDRPVSDYGIGWQILLTLTEPLIGMEGETDLDPESISLLNKARRSGSVSLRLMNALCQSEEAPLHALPTAIRMIEHSTENAFLDPTDEMPCEDMFWEVEDVALLVQHWQEAQAMLEQTDELAEWLASDRQRIRKVVDLWNRSIVTS